MNIEVTPIKTRYLKRGEDYLEVIVTSLKRDVENGLKLEDEDFVVISEKFVATGEDNLVDEKDVKAGSLAYLCYIWSKYVCGYILGPRHNWERDVQKIPLRGDTLYCRCF